MAQTKRKPKAKAVIELKITSTGNAFADYVELSNKIKALTETKSKLAAEIKESVKKRPNGILNSGEYMAQLIAIKASEKIHLQNAKEALGKKLQPFLYMGKASDRLIVKKVDK